MRKSKEWGIEVEGKECKSNYCDYCGKGDNEVDGKVSFYSDELFGRNFHEWCRAKNNAYYCGLPYWLKYISYHK